MIWTERTVAPRGRNARLLSRRPTHRGSASFAVLLVVGAILAGVAVAVVVAVRAAGPGEESPATRSAAVGPAPADNPLRSPAGSQNGSSSKPPTKPSTTPSTAPAPQTSPSAAPPGGHPLDLAISTAEKVLEHLRKDVKDYACVIVKQERAPDGTLGPPVFMAAKIRQQPFSVYLDLLKPDDVRGREVIYVAGANDGKLLARDGSGWTRNLGVLPLEPTGPVAMNGERYPITDIGLMHLTERLLQIAKRDNRPGDIEVHYFKDAKVNGRACNVIEVVHPVKQQQFMFYKAMIYIDDKLNVPIHYVAYMWPQKPGQEPPLDESYTYLNLKLNVGLTDADFDPHNPKYHFYGK